MKKTITAIILAIGMSFGLMSHIAVAQDRSYMALAIQCSHTEGVPVELSPKPVIRIKGDSVLFYVNISDTKAKSSLYIISRFENDISLELMVEGEEDDGSVIKFSIEIRDNIPYNGLNVDMMRWVMPDKHEVYYILDNISNEPVTVPRMPLPDKKS
ncbi:hypothetical protein LCGC14_1101430 [marine sediment metagenome]|uniref:Uncharacterized protein n=1 Tax=marine sediment metagenome TaxID=412755 RepID=A0A0F9MX66_9ZZZZ